MAISTILFPNSIIEGFEADSYIYSVLKKNIDRRNYSNVTINNLAIWKEETELEFFSEGADGGRITNNYNTKTAKKVKTVKSQLVEKMERVYDFGLEFPSLAQRKLRSVIRFVEGEL